MGFFLRFFIISWILQTYIANFIFSKVFFFTPSRAFPKNHCNSKNSKDEKWRIKPWENCIVCELPLEHTCSLRAGTMSHTSLHKTCLAYVRCAESAKQQVSFVTAPVIPALSSQPLGYFGGEAKGESGVCVTLFSPLKRKDQLKADPTYRLLYCLFLLVNG